MNMVKVLVTDITKVSEKTNRYGTKLITLECITDCCGDIKRNNITVLALQYETIKLYGYYLV